MIKPVSCIAVVMDAQAGFIAPVKRRHRSQRYLIRRAWRTDDAGRQQQRRQHQQMSRLH